MHVHAQRLNPRSSHRSGRLWTLRTGWREYPNNVYAVCTEILYVADRIMQKAQRSQHPAAGCPLEYVAVLHCNGLLNPTTCLQCRALACPANYLCGGIQNRKTSSHRTQKFSVAMTQPSWHFYSAIGFCAFFAHHRYHHRQYLVHAKCLSPLDIPAADHQILFCCSSRGRKK